MKKIPLIALVAVALGALAWACSDQATGPTTPLDLDQPAFHHGPDHAKGGGGNGGGGDDGGGGGGGGGSATGALADAMTTTDPTAQPVTGKENKKSLQYNTDQNALPDGGTIAFDFATAKATYDAGGCTTNQAGADATDLAAQLTATAIGATFNVQLDKKADGSVSSGHGIVAFYGDFRVGLPPHRNPTGTVVSDDGSTITMEFTGGDVRVWRISDDLRLFCSNPVGGDTVTVTVTR